MRHFESLASESNNESYDDMGEFQDHKLCSEMNESKSGTSAGQYGPMWIRYDDCTVTLFTHRRQVSQ